MKSSFGRNFLSASLILLLTLILLGSVFQQLTDNYLTDFTFRRLDENLPAGHLLRHRRR